VKLGGSWSLSQLLVAIVAKHPLTTLLCTSSERGRTMYCLRFFSLLFALSLLFPWSRDIPSAHAATLGPGPKISIAMVGQSIPTLLQYTKVEVSYTKEITPQRSNGRVEIKLSTWSEMNFSGNEIIRLTRQGQVEIGGTSLTYMAGDVPLLDAADLAGLNPTIEQARKVMDSLTPTVNQELERFGVKIIASYPFPAQVLILSCSG
jgi:TRAP-type C4-dicarboxylate transport system substrate-binding protein